MEQIQEFVCIKGGHTAGKLIYNRHTIGHGLYVYCIDIQSTYNQRTTWPISKLKHTVHRPWGHGGEQFAQAGVHEGIHISCYACAAMHVLPCECASMHVLPCVCPAICVLPCMCTGWCAALVCPGVPGNVNVQRLRYS